MNENERKYREKIYMAIDLKSFYASVECVERHLDPLKEMLVVADDSRTEKTICLAVTPSLKALGVSGRPRLFEVNQKVKEINLMRRCCAPGREFTGASSNADELEAQKGYELSFITAVPRMALYMHYSNVIYQIYLKYVAAEDIHIYSVDEVFMDITNYLLIYKKTPEELTRMIIMDVYNTTGITATAGIGSNLYLCKVAMDIVAKHMKADAYGVRIASLDEQGYRQMLWDHQPLTDFWRVGKGYAKKLMAHGMYTMGDVARCSLGTVKDYYNLQLLYKLFGINAELLVDHAWGVEPCTIEQIKAYRPQSNSLSSGQVLTRPYGYEEGKIVLREMAESLSLDLVEKQLVTDQIVITIGYDRENLEKPERALTYTGEVVYDGYGRRLPKHAHGTGNLSEYTASTKSIIEIALAVYEREVNPAFTIRRCNITANHVIPEGVAEVQKKNTYEQMSLFVDYELEAQRDHQKKEEQEKEKRIQKAMIEIKHRYGKNAILTGTNFKDGATMRDRNQQIGGHKA